MSDDYALVRVKDPVSGAEYTTSAANAEASGLTVLNKPALDDFGNPAIGKPATPKGAKPTSKESA